MRVALTLCILVGAFVVPALSLFCGQGNCYEILNVPRNSTKAEIRRSYRQLSAENHPDSFPNDEKKKEKFQKIVDAYEALKDDKKRAQYDDFLDNPGKYWDYLVRNSKEVYAPKSNTILVLIGLLCIMNIVHWFNMNHSYRQTLQRMKESQDFKRQVTQLIKSKKAKTKEEAEAMIDINVVGLEEPHWRKLIIFKMVQVPRDIGKLAAWKARWIFSYKIRKLEYSEEDKLYLIQQNLGLDDSDMAKLTDKEKKEYIEKEIWDKEKAEDFLRLKRIELNRMGKGKKKKRHTATPYSEAEEVSME